MGCQKVLSQDTENCLSCMPAKIVNLARHKSSETTVEILFQGMAMDPEYMLQKSKDTKRIYMLEAYQVHDAYFLFVCALAHVLMGPTTKRKYNPSYGCTCFCPVCDQIVRIAILGWIMVERPRIIQ